MSTGEGFASRCSRIVRNADNIIVLLDDPSSAWDVLVVDNEPKVRASSRRLLRCLGYDRVQEATDGVEALGLLQKQRVRVVITDLQMPRMNGLRMVRKLRAMGHRLPVIMVSSVGEPLMAAAALQAGADAYLTKPLDVERLSAALEQVLGNPSEKAVA